ncbi:MAG TPA: HNH endonuclease signature motif containing protein [Candidatus Krumholzibacteria bacterium]|nr:HNH endonuclease signature motif containing protein [Candidatus Krumholzibacteria bacterium]
MSLSLRSLSDKDILSRTVELTRRERSATLSVLQHLNEIERRKLHLKQAYASMFDYCTNGLGYSESAANLRIRAARCLACFPEVYGLLDAGEVNPSTISQVSKILTPENKGDILSRIRNKSQREVEAIVAEYDPRAALPGDRVRTVVMRVPVVQPAADAAPEAIPAPAVDTGWQENHRCNSGDLAGARAEPPACPGEVGGAAHFQFQTRKVFKFTATEAFEKKFEKIKSLAAHRLPPNPSYEQVFEVAMDLFLEKHDPSARRERRENQEGRLRAGTSQASREGRYVPVAVRDQVFARDNGQCTYKGPDGRRCGSRHVLQIDHRTPVARGGASTMDNLRLLCAYHNRLEAERLMGARPTTSGS